MTKIKWISVKISNLIVVSREVPRTLQKFLRSVLTPVSQYHQTNANFLVFYKKEDHAYVKLIVQKQNKLQKQGHHKQTAFINTYSNLMHTDTVLYASKPVSFSTSQSAPVYRLRCISRVLRRFQQARREPPIVLL